MIDTLHPEHDWNEEVKAELFKRMRRIEGQCRGIQNMLESGADCENVLIQLAAIRAGLNRVGLKLLGCRLARHMTDEIRSGGSGQDAVEEALESFLRF